MSKQTGNKTQTGYEKYIQRHSNDRKRTQKRKDVGAWIAECDGSLSKKLWDIAEEINSDKEIKIIRLVGPTCSGKTTAAKMLHSRLCELGKRLHVISVDDFYFNTDVLREMSVKKEGDAIDYDSPKTIDHKELERFVNEIFTEEKSHCPIFDFNIGRRNGYREYLCEEKDIFLFEGIQVLYPSVSEIFLKTGHPSAEIYIAPQSSISICGQVFEPNEIRLMRRIVRDKLFRNTEAEFTFDMWQGVRDNEEKNIFPYASSCKYSIDSTQPYEIGVLKPHLVCALSSIPQDSKYRKDADRMLQKTDRILEISDTLIQEGSIYKEFV